MLVERCSAHTSDAEGILTFKTYKSFKNKLHVRQIITGKHKQIIWFYPNTVLSSSRLGTFVSWFTQLFIVGNTVQGVLSQMSIMAIIILYTIIRKSMHWWYWTISCSLNCSSIATLVLFNCSIALLFSIWGDNQVSTSLEGSKWIYRPEIAERGAAGLAYFAFLSNKFIEQ
jgi:hypothetical protein